MKFIKQKQLICLCKIILLKLWFLCVCKILGNFLKNVYFVMQEPLIKVPGLKILCLIMWHIKLWLSTAHHILFLLNQFSFKFKFYFEILWFLTAKLILIALPERSVSQENAFKRKQMACCRFCKNIGWNNSYCRAQRASRKTL